MPRRRPRRTVRHWRRVVGLVTPGQVQDLQTKVHDYHEKLLIALTNLETAWAQGPQPTGAPLPTTGKFTKATWDEMTAREEKFLAGSVNELNPLAWADASTLYDQGRGLVTELDAWRDELESLKAPGVPGAPLPIPSSQTGFLSDIGLPLMLVLGIVLLHELKGFKS